MSNAPREFRARYLDDKGDRIASEIFLARSISQAVAFARKRAPAGAVKLRVGRRGEGKWEGSCNIRSDAA